MEHTGRFARTDDVAAFVQQVCGGEHGGIGEGQLVIGVDADLCLVGVAVKVEESPLDAEVLALLAEELAARALFLVFLRGGLDGMPDAEEARHLVALVAECERQGTGLVDGVVVTDQGYWSLRGVAAMADAAAGPSRN